MRCRTAETPVPGRPRSRLPAGAVALAAALGGCGGPATPDDAAVRVDTLPGGAVRVANLLPAGGDVPAAPWTLTEDLRLDGREAGEEAPGFVAVTDVAEGPAGGVLVLDGVTRLLHVYDAGGRPLRRVGGEGQGPGELRGPAGMEVTPDGVVVVADPRNRRYTLFAPDGSVRTTLPRRLVGAVTPWSGTRLDGGGLLDWGLAFPDERPGVVAGATVLHVPVRIDPAADAADTFPAVRFVQDMLPDGSAPQVFFSADLQVAATPDGAIWFAHGREYALVRRTLEGDTTTFVSLPGRPAPVTGADVAAVRERMASRPGLLQAYLDALPGTKPVVRRILADGAGHVYVVPELDGVPAGSVVDVFREDGRLVGRLELPVAMDPRAGARATDRHLYVVTRDSLDVPSVVRLRIGRGGSGARPGSAARTSGRRRPAPG